MNVSYWRVRSRLVIRKVIAENPDADPKTLQKLISAAYPFGQRAYHPYKIWLSEVKEFLAPQPDPGACWCAHGKASHRAKGACFAADCTCQGWSKDHPNQIPLLTG